MVEEKKDPVFERLVDLLGPANVTRTGDNILVKPAAAGEIAGVIRLAREENRAVAPLHYRIGPAISPGQGEKILLSLERMNQIRYFDRQSLYLIAEPAVASGEITALIASAGLHFPGIECLHRKPTIGENVAACFTAEKPDFQCPVACLCGLEMVLLTGEIISAGGSCLSSLGNYELSYILGAKSDEPAVITGIHMKMLPGGKSGMFLATVLKRPEQILAGLPALLAKHREEILRFVVAGASAVSPAAAQLSRFLPPAREPGAFALFVLRGDCPEPEAVAGDISAACREWGTGEVVLTGATQQKERLSFLYDSLLAELKSDPALVAEDGFRMEEAGLDDPSRLKALTWQDGKFTAYYGD